jgi:hypothetical protein
MSWNGTVTCSYCYEDGHNRRGCPTRKKEIAERREAHGDEDYRVRNYDAHRENTSRVGEKRCCTYCDGLGHNRRTCEPLKKDIATLIDRNRRYRAVFLDYLRSTGLGVGSILSSERLGGTILHLVVGIEWGQVSYMGRSDYSDSRVLRTRQMANLGRGEYRLNIPRANHPVFTEMCTRFNETVVSSPKGADKLSPPDGWLDAVEDVDYKAVLKETTHWKFENGYV